MNKRLEESSNKKTVLVTGASGYIGKALCQRLQAEGHYVKALLRKPIAGPWNEKILYDFKDLNQNQAASHHSVIIKFLQGVNTLFHLGGIAHTDSRHILKKDYLQINVEATKKLLSLAADAGVQKFIYFSSIKAHEANDEYGRSKLAAEHIVLEQSKKHDIQVCVLRPALVYGSEIKGNLLSMLRWIDKGWFPPLPETHNARSMIFIQDLIEAALLVSNTAAANGKIYTLTDGHAYSTKALYDAMRLALGLKPSRFQIPLWILRLLKTHSIQKLLSSSVYSSEPIHHELGWSPKTNFFQSLPEMVNSYRKNKRKLAHN